MTCAEALLCLCDDLLEIFHNKCPIAYHLYITVVIATLCNLVSARGCFYTQDMKRKTMCSLTLTMCLFLLSAAVGILRARIVLYFMVYLYVAQFHAILR